MRAIDADALLHELKNCHYPGAPYVDAGISIAIGKVCDALTIEPERKKGHWIWHPEQRNIFNGKTIECSECHEKYTVQYVEDELFCRHCGADMRTPVEIARNIVHKVIDNSVWSDTVDTAKMHKVVDDKYAEMTEGEE